MIYKGGDLILTNDNKVRRNDLSLRLKYIGIKTRIFKIAPFMYVILCSNIPDDFEKIKTYFDRSIRYVTLQISLSDQVPEHYIEELSPIDMEHPVDDFRATARTRAEIEEYIYGRYHDFDIRKIVPSEGGINFHMDIYVGSDVSDKQIARLQKELTEVDFGTDQIQVLRTTDPPEDKTKLNPQDSVMWLNTNKSYPFTVAETDFWYDNIEAIYDGSVKRKDLSFCRDGELKCFVNASVFPVINLRSLLLLYDTVYLALPIENFLDEFLEMQGMKKKELVQLVSMGKVVLLLGNDETRYDRQVILDAYKESPDSVIGRRAMNAMMIAQLVEMKNQYAANYPMAYEMASQLAKYGNQKQDEVALHISELLAWPYRVVGESFGILQNSSPMAVSNFGINRLAYNFFREHDQKSAIEFEFISKAESAHLAMALDATYFPFRAENDNKIYTDEAETSMMEGMMKVYWYAPEQVKRMQSIWNTNYTERNMLEFFDTKENIDILRTANMADKYQTPLKFRAILENLEKMEETDRRQKIREYNNILAEASERTAKSTSIVDFMLGTTGFLNFGSYLNTILNLLGLLKGVPDMMPGATERKDLQKFRSIAKELGTDNPEKTGEEVYLLDRISPVANLR